MTISRRSAIAGSVAAAAAIGVGAVAWQARGDAIPGTLSGADFARGHRLRDGVAFPPPTREISAGIAILGGGVAGLSAAWTLAEAGVTDFRLFELEDSAGGNARSGRNAVSAYPLGAHYLPIPNAEAKGVVRLLERLGIVTGHEGGKPIFDPYQIVSDPDERLLHLGKWQEGLVPTIGLTAIDRHDLDAFFTTMARYRDRRDAEGHPAFALPMEFSARDPDLLALDRLSFTAWLDAQGWHSPVLRGHVRYACRDDYGTEPEHVSAWAGIHYFASRRGVAANVSGDTVLTWPEGNGHLVGRMAARLRPHLECGQIVHRVRRESGGVAIDSFDVATGTSLRIHARGAVLATPHFVSSRLLPPGQLDAAGFGYAPWVVANVMVDRPPAGAGFQLAWDNVSWTSRSLGYVVATHQSLATTPGPTVLTWYLPLSDMPPAEARRELIDRPLGYWQEMVRDDLLQTNPDLEGAISRIDVWRWGHAMIRPVPGFFWGGARAAAAAPKPPLFFAHSDLSGLSLFEEAHYRGTQAAQDAMTHLGISYADALI
ncbi:MAG: twin-arginine translocation pathway signal protein [Sphingomonas bacterium]|uniref:FAD-dependent oxidoreductase n=1 Tax=Sphingomonas bacterium TaxID=1895847 RepID=UPI00262E8B7A|nr:FAD-dependent oxidoreductase [Sphingomonas bacterium]MDB5703928.1 twin-arginine translocation pathway signal protein [Sphingomonas bacterium]